MSLLNVWVEPGRALVSIDTDASRGDDRLEASKLVAFPADRMVVACRGNLGVLNGLLPALHGMPGGVDTIAPVLPMLCADMASRLDAYAAQQGHSQRFEEVEIVIAGWSAREQRMAAYACIRNADEERFAMLKIETPQPDAAYLVAPNANWQRALPPDCPEHMQAIAKDQVRYMRRLHPDCAIGGRLLMAEVTECEVSVRELMRFPERAPAQLGRHEIL